MEIGRNGARLYQNKLSDDFDLSGIDGTDKEVYEHVNLLKVSSISYIGKLDNKTMKVLGK